MISPRRQHTVIQHLRELSPFQKQHIWKYLLSYTFPEYAE